MNARTLPALSIADINRQTAQLRSVRREIESLPPLTFRVTPRELKNSIIACDPLSHRDLVDVLMGLAAKVKAGKGSALGEKCARSVAEQLVDMAGKFSELADEIDQDLVNQQAGAV